VRVEIRLFATLTRHRQDTASGQPFEVELAGGATIGDLLRKLAVPPDDVHLTIIDGRLVHGGDVHLHEGARVGLFPPIGGG